MLYILYFLTTGYITYNILHFTYNYCINKHKKIDGEHKKNDKSYFENNNNYSFLIKNIEFYKNNYVIKCSNYNNFYFKQTDIIFNLSFDYDYYIINYVFNDTEYKYMRNDKNMNIISFPMYKLEEIKNYVYTNKISKALLIISEENTEIFEEIDILKYLLPFLGPNYNFYYDKEYKLDIKLVLKHILVTKSKELFFNDDDNNNSSYDNYYRYYENYNRCYNKILSNNKYLLKLYDTFGNIYQFENNNINLHWNPNLQL